MQGCFIDSESVIFNKNAALALKGFREKYKYIADFDFFIRMGEKYNFAFTTEVLAKWRIHENQSTNRMVNYIFGRND